LIGPGFERGQFGFDTGAGVLWSVVGHVRTSGLL
jgi:hypothetical protein